MEVTTLNYVGRPPAPFQLNQTTIGSSYTIPNGCNAISAGPISIASGATVTVGAGSTWTVI